MIRYDDFAIAVNETCRRSGWLPVSAALTGAEASDTRSAHGHITNLLLDSLPGMGAVVQKSVQPKD